MTLQLLCDSRFKTVRLVSDLGHVALHQSPDRLVHRLLTQLERVAYFDRLHVIEGVLARDRLTWGQPVSL